MNQLGKYDQRVTLYSRSVAKDAMGQDAITWVEEVTVWARRINWKADEVFQAAQTGDDSVVELHIRYRSDVTTSWRLVWGGVGYDITSATPYGGREDRTRLLCRKGVKDGR